LAGAKISKRHSQINKSKTNYGPGLILPSSKDLDTDHALDCSRIDDLF